MFWITEIALVYKIQTISIDLRNLYYQPAQKNFQNFHLTFTKAPQIQHPKFVVRRYFLYIFSVFLNNE